MHGCGGGGVCMIVWGGWAWLPGGSVTAWGCAWLWGGVMHVCQGGRA